MDLDADPDPVIFVSDLQGDKEINKTKKIPSFFCLLGTYSLKVHSHHFSKIKSHKKVTKK
jgi:hypothetical protein